MPTTYTTIATEATKVQKRCSPEERRGGGGVSEQLRVSMKYVEWRAGLRTFEARIGHVGHKKELAVHIDALVRHENFGANRRVQKNDDDDRELDCLRGGRLEREATARKLTRNASCVVREPLEHNACNGEDDEGESENAENDERLRPGGSEDSEDVSTEMESR